MAQARISHENESRGIEIVLLFTAFIASAYGFGMYLFPAMVELIRQSMSLPYDAVGLISGFVQAGFMASALLSGVMTVSFGALPVILGSIAICAAALGGLANVENVFVLGALLTVLGGCAAAIWVPMLEVCRAVISHRHQAKALGLISSGTSYGVFVNSLLITNFSTQYGWRFIWTVTSMCVAVLTLVGFMRLRRIGKKSAGTPSPTHAGPRRRARFGIFSRKLTLAVSFMMFLNGLSCLPFQTYLSSFIQGEAEFSQETAAIAWRLIGIVGMVGGFALGALADRITVRWAMTLTCGILAASCILLVVGAGNGYILPIYLSAFGFGLGFYSVFGLVPAYISHAFEAGDAALVFAVGNIALSLGGIAGNVLGGMLKVATSSFEAIYWVMTAAATCAALLSIALPSERSFRVAP